MALGNPGMLSANLGDRRLRDRMGQEACMEGLIYFKRAAIIQGHGGPLAACLKGHRL